MKKSKFLFIFLTLLSTNFYANAGGVQKAIFNSDIAKLEKLSTKGNCFAKEYLNLLKFSNYASSCVSDLNAETEDFYNVFITAAKVTAAKSLFSESRQYLDSIKMLDINSEILEAIRQRESILEFRATQEKNNFLGDNISVNEDFSVEVDLFDSIKTFYVDTGAALSSFNFEKIKFEEIGNIFTFKNFIGSNFVSKVHALNFMGSVETFLSSSSENYIGLSVLMKYNYIDFLRNNSSKRKRIGLDLYFDGDNIFFTGDLVHEGSLLQNQNFCIDTGAAHSTGMPKLYRNSRHLLTNNPIKKFSAGSSNGEINNLGKISKSLLMIINDKRRYLGYIPIMFRTNSSPSCDIVLGRDWLAKNLTRIDFTDKKIYFLDDQ